ncbi:hypothetical protein [uncultured Roseibium sp.]|uniref:hypothetical protein n=1 Tax=uncultured Roseibium sp. TaxID=1936171 RepID=UPI00261706E3|nr:hypothetical protein [uncultured Roseibium sp.]
MTGPDSYLFRASDEDGFSQEWLVDDFEEQETEIHLYRKGVFIYAISYDDWDFIEGGRYEAIH